MQNVIAGAMAVLGTLLVLSGGAVIVARAMREPSAADAPTVETAPASATKKVVNAMRNMPAADRLIGWGIVLLVLAAVAAGAISFSLGANAGTR
ncbi:MAG: hypothetical protein FWJ93_13945 [Micromonosporaceae bacterium]